MTLNFLENDTNTPVTSLLPNKSVVDCIIEIKKDPNTGDIVTDSKSSDAKFLNLRLEILDDNMKPTGMCIYHLLGIKGNSAKVAAKGGMDAFAYYGREAIRKILCYNWHIPLEKDKRTEGQKEKLKNVSSYEVLNGMECKIFVGIKKDAQYGDKNIVSQFITSREVKSTLFPKYNTNVANKAGNIQQQEYNKAGNIQTETFIDDEIPF